MLWEKIVKRLDEIVKYNQFLCWPFHFWSVHDTTLWGMEYEITHVKGLIKAVQDMVSNDACLICWKEREREVYYLAGNLVC